MHDEQDELDGLPPIVWRAKVSPSLDRREQLRRYSEVAGTEAAKRQVRLAREELARRRRKR